jgi:hypothetical protein
VNQFPESEPSPDQEVLPSTLHKLIRSTRTKAFLLNNGTWAKDIQKAAQFANFSLAHAAIQKFELRDIELYYAFNEHATSQYDFAISLQ